MLLISFLARRLHQEILDSRRASGDRDETQTTRTPTERNVEQLVEAMNIAAGKTTVRARPASEKPEPTTKADCGDVLVDCAGQPAYQLQGEFLLEAETGRVWRYDDDSDAFVELRRLSSPLGEIVQSDILQDHIQQLRNALEHDLLEIPKQQQKAVREALEKKYIEPLQEEEKARAAQLKSTKKKLNNAK